MSDDVQPNRIPAISSYLQERLQQERRDGERNSPRASAGRNTPTAGFRDDDVSSTSPLRINTAMGRRPRSASGDEADSQKGYGSKEMEKNFDLKVELYHRRERQTALEQRNATLERDQAELMELNESVWSELEKRDIALKEAIALIMGLEDRVGELLLEREMVRQVEADGTYRHSRNDESELDEPAASTPKAQRFPGTLLVDDDKVLDRMPSFMSERSAHTENLRNVILNDKSSIFHLRKVSQSSVDTSEFARVTSPSLSVLSESSFMSVYGGKDKVPADELSHPLDFPDDKVDELPVPERQPSWECQKDGSASRTGNGTFKSGAGFSLPPQSLGASVDMPSPLQQLERLESRLASGEIRIPSIASRGSSNSIKMSSPARHSAAASHVKTKQEKREALRRVKTSTPTDKDLAAAQALPPTPDTVSTNTLRRYHNSNDNLSYDHRSTPQTSQFDESSKVSSGQYSLESSLDGRGNAASQTSQTASTSAFTSRRQAPSQQFNPSPITNYSQYGHLLPPRPHSACETASSLTRADSWASDSDDSDGGADAFSEDDDSNFDYWMREGSKVHDGNLRLPPHRRKSEKPTPDLFNFPEAGWKAEALFGAMERSGVLGSPASGLKRETHDVLPPSMGQSDERSFEAPAPSELEGGITPPIGDQACMLAQARNNSFGNSASRMRSNSIGSSVPAPRQQQPPTQQGQAGAMPAGKRNQYPPIAGQATRSRGFNGLNGLFRRGAVEDNNAQQQAEPRHAKPPGRMSVPPPAARPWASRPPDAVNDDLTSATPAANSAKPSTTCTHPRVRRCFWRPGFCDTASRRGGGIRSYSYDIRLGRFAEYTAECQQTVEVAGARTYGKQEEHILRKCEDEFVLICTFDEVVDKLRRQGGR
ncbi:uncharacterized protein PG998_009019 [Apiospora kogelbergensis]|uniref:uncharacterized protein n=1 Tax=Apiospora kogelbergensis TaxID=1337665 RepID=UPI00312F7289